VVSSTSEGIWLRPIAGAIDSNAVEGLDLLPDGRLHLVGIYSMDGLTWEARTDSLTLTTATERYPEPNLLSYRIKKLDADSLVLAGPGYLSGRYRRSNNLTNKLAQPRSRAAAIKANRAAYRTLSGSLRQNDAIIRFTAYSHDENLRFIEEQVHLGARGSELRHYYFEENRLFYYRADEKLVSAGHVDSSLVLLAFDEDGSLEQAIKVKDGHIKQLQPHEKTAPRERLRLLRAQIAAHLGYGQLMRGYLRMGHEVRSFVPCGSEREYWVDDLTGANLYSTYRSLAMGIPADYAPLYVELDAFAEAPKSEGFAADYDSLLTTTELRFAARETRACADDIENVVLRAQGNEPFWNLAVHAEGIRIQQMGYETLNFPVDLKALYLHPTTEDPQLYHAQIDTTHSLHLRLERQPCRDSMAGNYHHFTAEIELDGHILSGCARAGALPAQ